MSQYWSDDVESAEPGRASLLADAVALLACLAAALMVHRHEAQLLWSHQLAAAPALVVSWERPQSSSPAHIPLANAEVRSSPTVDMPILFIA
jgi:hypothetical protein